MKKILVFLILFSTALQIKCQNFSWAKQFGNGIEPYAVTTDKGGNVYTTGRFYGWNDFDPGPGTYTLASNGMDVFISKLDSTGNFAWAKKVGGKFTDIGYDIKTDKYNNVYILGIFNDSADFDPGPALYNLASTSFFAPFILKLSPSGTLIWAKAFTGSGTYGTISLMIDSLQNVYTVGAVSGPGFDMDPGAGVYSVSTPSYVVSVLSTTYTAYVKEFYISKLDSNGNFVYAIPSPLTPVDARGVITQNDELILIGSDANGTVAKYTADGNLKWSKNISGGSNFSIAVDKLNNICMTGYFTGTMDFDPGPGIYNLASGSSASLFILKLDSLGNFMWANKIDGLTGQYIKTACDSLGNIYITSQFGGGIPIHFDFDPNSQANVLNSSAGRGFILCVQSNGAFNWVKQLGEGQDPYGGLRPYALTLDAFGNLYTCGEFSGAVDMDCGPGVYNLACPPGAYVNGFVHKLSLPLLGTGILELNSRSGLNVFPNPTTSIVNFRVSNDLYLATCRVIDVNGRIVLEANAISGKSFSINLSEQAKGLYVVEVFDNHTITRIKLLKD